MTLNTNASCGAKVAVDLDPCDACAAYQLFKLAFGGLNTFTLVTACAGLPVDVKNATIAVTDNCGALTVDGTVTANLSCTDNTVLDNIQTAVQVIDNSVYVDDADWTDGSSSHTLVGGLYQSSPQTVTDGDVAPFNITVNGALHTAVQNTVTVTGDCGGSLTVDNAGLTELAAAINSSRVDVGNQTNNISAPGATNVGALVGIANTCPPSYTDGRQVLLSTNLSGAVRVTTSDCGGLLVNLGGNNDVTVTSGCITADLGANNDVTIDGSAVIQTFDAAADFITCGADTAIAPAFVRDDALSCLTPAAGDYVPGFVNQRGALWTAIDPCQNTVAICGTVTVDLGANNDVTGTVSHNGAAPVACDQIGALVAIANACGPTYTEGRQVLLSTNLSGALRVTGGGGGTEYCEDVATPATITGTATLMERDDALGGVTPIEGDWIGLRGNSQGALWTAIVDACGNAVTCFGGSSSVYVDDADWTDSTSSHTLVGGLYQSTPQTVTDGDVGPFNMTTNGALHVAQQGTVTVTGDCSGSLTVDGTVAVSSITTSITPGVAAANLGKAEDAAHTSGDTGVMSLAVRNDTLAALAGTSGDYAPLQVGANGSLYVRPVGSAAGDLGKAEDAAHTSGDVGVMALSVRQASATALAGTNGDYQPLITSTAGRLFTTSTIDAALPTGANTIGNVGTIATSVTPGTGATNLGKAIGNAQGATDTGVAILAVRNDQIADLSGADHDYAPLQLSETGALYVTNVPNRAHASAGDNGLEVHLCLDADETEVQVSANPTLLYGLAFSNSCACNNEFLKLWNAVPACVTVGGCAGTTPKIVQMIPKGAAGHISYCPPIYFDTAMSIGAVCGAADSAATGATTVVANVFFRDTT